MFNLLRKIRKQLLDNGHLKKYLLYAVGEIILVVVGILIALQLNNWNQKVSDKKLEIQYYQSMKSQLNEDLGILIGNIQYNQDHLNQIYYAKSLLMQRDRSEMDTLAKITLNMMNYSDFRRKSNVYQTLVNSGEIKNVNNHKIVEELQSLEETYSYINRIEETNRTVIVFQIVPEIKQIIRVDPIKVENKEALFSYQFLNGLDLLIHLLEEKKEAYEVANNEITAAINFIDQELALNKKI